MRKQQQGYTLLELLLTMFIVFILATMGLSTYQDYMVRAQVIEGVVKSRAARDYMIEDHMVNGAWPNNNNLANMLNQNELGGEYTKSLKVNNNEITVMYGNNANGQIHHSKVKFSLDFVNGRYQMNCAGHALFPEKFLPRACLGVDEKGNNNNGDNNGNGNGKGKGK